MMLETTFEWDSRKPAAHHHYIMPCMPGNVPAASKVRRLDQRTTGAR